MVVVFLHVLIVETAPCGAVLLWMSFRTQVSGFLSICQQMCGVRGGLLCQASCQKAGTEAWGWGVWPSGLPFPQRRVALQQSWQDCIISKAHFTQNFLNSLPSPSPLSRDTVFIQKEPRTTLGVTAVTCLCGQYSERDADLWGSAMILRLCCSFGLF